MSKTLFYHIGKFSEFPIWQKAIIALRRKGACRFRDPPQAENPANRILFYAQPRVEEISHYAAHGARSE